MVIDDFNDKSTKCNTLSEALQKQAMKNGYVRTAGIGLHRIFIDGKNWSEANETCHDEGGHLAVINSRAEEQVIIFCFSLQDCKSVFTNKKFSLCKHARSRFLRTQNTCYV